MSLSFCSLSSGSSGNCYIVTTENTALLVDAGISGKKIFEGLSALGIPDEKLMGLLVTHEHIDHVKSVRILTKKKPFINVYGSESTLLEVEECVPMEKKRIAFPKKEIMIGDIKVKPFSLSHDASDPLGYSFTSGGKTIAIVTDTGVITEEIHSEIRKADILVIEANHDVHTLQFCRYPYPVKRRIMGDFGHLSNNTAAEEIARICLEARGDGEIPHFRQVILAHLSKENNFPEMAYQTVKNALEENDIYIGRELTLDIIERDIISPVFRV
ncbi:MAG: MBL fold metallo-hydrolase [Firmicutes bacterium]|nr:MBL fold metallo-hydrolase [Bacillota bacterium]